MGDTENLVESTNILVQVASWATLRVEKSKNYIWMGLPKYLF